MRRRRLLLWTICLLLLISDASSSSAKKEDETEKGEKKQQEKLAADVIQEVAQDRFLDLEDLEERFDDQLAVESGSSYQQIAPPPSDYGAPAPFPEPIPVPLPVPVRPGSIVLPGIPIETPKSAGYGGSPGVGHGGGFSGGHGGGFSGGHGGGFSGGHDGGFSGGHGGGFSGGHDGGFSGGHGGVFSGGHDGGFSGGHSGGFSGGHGKGVGAPPPVVYKQPHVPLTRSSNPSPVSHLTKGGAGGYQPPPPPPPHLPQQEYSAPQPIRLDYSPPPQDAYSAPSGTQHAESLGPVLGPPPPYTAPSGGGGIPAEVYNAPSVPSGAYSAPKPDDIYEGRQPILSQGSVAAYSAPVPVALPSQGFNYQAPAPQLPAPAFLGPSVGPLQSGPSLGSAYVPPGSGGLGGGGHDDVWPSAAPEMPHISNINVKCEKNLMRVTIEFDRPFYGIIFSKGHYSNVNCVHLPAGLGRSHATFDISINSCGTTGNTDSGGYGQSGAGTFFENTLVVQYDPQVQEVWDQARKLRCTWHDQYEKSVTFRPFPVDMLDVVRADFAGDNVGCWMQIQVGKGPWASEVSGLVKIGQTMTMVLAIKDEDNKFDMLVRNCMAHDGRRAPIQLVDQRGCVTRPKLMSKFTKIKNFGASASVLSYAHFQAFKFPDSMEVHFQCTIQICRHQCPEQCLESGSFQQPGEFHNVIGGIGDAGGAYSRRRREVESGEEADVGVNRIIQVVSTRDLGFLLDKNEVLEEIRKVESEALNSSSEDPMGLICMSTPGFAATLVVLLSILIISCLLSAFLCLRFRGSVDTQSIISAYQNPVFLHGRRFF